MLLYSQKTQNCGNFLSNLVGLRCKNIQHFHQTLSSAQKLYTLNTHTKKIWDRLLKLCYAIELYFISKTVTEIQLLYNMQMRQDDEKCIFKSSPHKWWRNRASFSKKTIFFFTLKIAWFWRYYNHTNFQRKTGINYQSNKGPKRTVQRPINPGLFKSEFIGRDLTRICLDPRCIGPKFRTSLKSWFSCWSNLQPHP